MNLSMSHKLRWNCWFVLITLCGCLTTPLRPKHRWRLSATSRLTRPMIHLGVTPSPVYVCGAPPLPNRYSDGGGLLETLVPCGREPAAARQTPSRLPREAGRPSICCLPGLIGRCIISPPLATPQDVISPSCGRVHGTVAMCAIILGRGSSIHRRPCRAPPAPPPVSLTLGA